MTIMTEEPVARQPPSTPDEGAEFAYVELTYCNVGQLFPANSRRVRLGPLPDTGALDAARDAAQWPLARDVRLVVSPWPLATGWFHDAVTLTELDLAESQERRAT